MLERNDRALKFWQSCIDAIKAENVVATNVEAPNGSKVIGSITWLNPIERCATLSHRALASLPCRLQIVVAVKKVIDLGNWD